MILAGDVFMHRLGASILERTVCGSCQASALVATEDAAFIDPESIVYPRYIVIWGANVLTSTQQLWPFIREARRRGRVVLVSKAADGLDAGFDEVAGPVLDRADGEAV